MLWIYFSIFIFISIIIIVSIGFNLVTQVSKPKIINFEETYKTEVDKGYITEDIYHSYNKEEILFNSFDNYKIHGEIIYNENKNLNKFVVLSHGYTYSRYGSIKYTNIFLKLGYNVLIYDLRNHGLNKPQFTTMGKNESKDLICIVEYIRTRFNPDLIGLHGESLGAATSILSLTSCDVDFVVADCAYSNLKQLLKYQLYKQHKLPSIFVSIASIMSYFFYHFTYDEISPIDVVKETKVPILFIHGEVDLFTPTTMSIDMHDVNKQNKIYIAKNAQHAMSYTSDTLKYEEVIKEFIEQYI